jgi:hypothetical protein
LALGCLKNFSSRTQHARDIFSVSSPGLSR